MASFHGLAGIGSILKLCLIAALLSAELNQLTRAVIKMSEILSAATVTTGAKMIPTTVFTLR